MIVVEHLCGLPPWLVEYMALKEKSQYINVSIELNDWGGSFVLRLMDLEELKSVFDFYDD
tara:strand:- start:747 stop:926 length:180 start_codon:yes stop_codon:yes gene_type:complete